jgi:hypothetical protein
MLSNLKKLWNDDAGSVIAAEYLALAGIVAMGGVAGLEAVRSATVDESQEVAKSIRAMNQSYHYPGFKTGSAATAGAGAIDNQQNIQVNKLTP